MAEQTSPKNPELPTAEAAARPGWPARLRGRLHGPEWIGIAAALVAIALSLFGMLTNSGATPLTLRSLVLVIVVVGGAWGLIAWAIATAAVEAGKD